MHRPGPGNGGPRSLTLLHTWTCGPRRSQLLQRWSQKRRLLGSGVFGKWSWEVEVRGELGEKEQLLKGCVLAGHPVAQTGSQVIGPAKEP